MSLNSFYKTDLFYNKELNQNHSKSFYINKCSCFPITVALGAISLGGVFLLLACYQILPHGINAMSGMGVWGRAIGYGTVGAGLVAVAISEVKRCVYKDAAGHTTPPQELHHTPSVEDQGTAAITLQKHYRGHLARKHVEEIKKSVLNYSLFAQAQLYTQDMKKLTGEPTAPQGNNQHKIYMPQDLPVVIRVCKGENDLSRFPKMRQALTICHQNNFQCVVVPKARLQGHFIVEERLPGDNASIIKGMAFYYANREHYTQAVREFTAFLCHGRLNDITGNSRHILNYQKIARIPRFDNLLLYRTEHEEESVYNIGIIDIETFQLNSPTPTLQDVDHALRLSIELFPYHFNAIIEVGRKFSTLSHEHIKRLQQQSLKSLEFYKLFCENLKTPMLISLTPERIEALKQHMGTFLLNMHRFGLNNYSEAKNCLKGDPNGSMDTFQSKIFPIMIDLVTKQLNAKLKIIIDDFSKSQLSHGQQIERRILRSSLNMDLQKELEVSELADTIFTADKYQHTVFALFEEILNQLVVGGELSYYKAQVYSNDDLIFF